MIKNCKSLLYGLVTDKEKRFIFLPVKFILRILSYIYAVGLILVIKGYQFGIFKSYKLDCKIISVGNLTVGGVGKTPMVEMLIRKLKNIGIKSAVLIRGYGSSAESWDADSLEKAGDEAVVLRENLPGVPVLIGRDRVKTGKVAIKNFGVNGLVLDDGFQFRRLKRDLDIVVVDSINPFGNKKLLPRGILREPIHNLRRASIYILTKADMGYDSLDKLINILNNINPKAEILKAVHKPICFYTVKDRKKLPLSFISEMRICALSGIGSPYYFEWILEKLKARIKIVYRFPDHYNYTQCAIGKVFSECKRKDVRIVVTTQKDKVRLPEIEDNELLDLVYLSVQFEILKGENILNEKLHNLFFG